MLRIADGSSVSKPGSRGTDWRVHGVYDLGAGGFSHLELTDRHGGEALDRGAGVEGEIRIADRGYSAAKALRRFVASVKQAKGRRLCCPVASPRMEANYRVKNEGLLSALSCAAF